LTALHVIPVLLSNSSFFLWVQGKVSQLFA